MSSVTAVPSFVHVSKTCRLLEVVRYNESIYLLVTTLRNKHSLRQGSLKATTDTSDIPNIDFCYAKPIFQ